MNADVIVVGAGLAGLVATAELVAAGRSVLLVDQEGEQGIGGQAYWSFGGLFLVDSPEQRRMGIKDSVELAWQDWMGSAQFDRPEDHWPRQWAEAYVHFAAGEKRAWLKERGHGLFPVVGWAERGGGLAGGHGNSVPRFHITWGTGPGLVAPFEKIVRAGPRRRARAARVPPPGRPAAGHRRHRHRRQRSGARADRPPNEPLPTSRTPIGEFALTAQAVIVTSGGIGGNHDLVRANWPDRLGTPPDAHDLRRPGPCRRTHARDRGEGRRQPHQPRPDVALRRGHQELRPDLAACTASASCPARRRSGSTAADVACPSPGLPGFDTLGTLKLLRASGHDHSWFVLTQAIIEKEFALSGQEQNPDLTGKSVDDADQGAAVQGSHQPRRGVQDAAARTSSWPTPSTELVAGMNALTPEAPVDVDLVRRQVQERDRELDNDFTKDLQIAAMRQARAYRGDKLVRVARPHKILDPAKGPLIAVRLHVLTRKSLGGLETNLDSQVLDARRPPAGGPLRRRRGGRVRRWRRPRLQLPGRHLPGRLPVQRTCGRTRRRPADRLRPVSARARWRGRGVGPPGCTRSPGRRRSPAHADASPGRPSPRPRRRPSCPARGPSR